MNRSSDSTPGLTVVVDADQTYPYLLRPWNPDYDSPVSVFEHVVNFLNHYIWAFPKNLPWLVAVLLAAGFWVTLRLGAIQFRQLKHAFDVVCGRYDDPAHQGDINHFEALSTALSATVGIGNIAGVAVAIHLGGPGAVFWMWVTATFGMALKYAECTLAMLHRDFDEQGNVAGGPMYYIEKGLGAKWKPMAVCFAVCTIIASFGGGNMSQSNTVAVSARADFGTNDVLVGLFLAIVVGAVILGGIKRIGRVSSKLAPAMAVVYVAGALTVLILHIDAIPGALMTIFHDAFSPSAGVGGSVAGGLMTTLVWGVKRGLFSNEAGQGSAPIAHAAAKTDEPVREGVVAMLGPLIDTLIICTMTALVIIVTGVWDEKHSVNLEFKNVTVIVHPSSITHVGTPYEHVQRALEAGTPASQQISVQGGKTTTLGFIAFDGFVDDAQLRDPKGNRFSGTAYFDAKTNTITGQGNIPLTLHGKALQTSSALTAFAFQRGLMPLGDWGNYIVTFAVFLFALSTMISWSYYGDRSVVYLLGYRYIPLYRGLYVCFVFVGAWAGLRVVWDYGDLALGLMTLPNLIAVFLLLPKVRACSDRYFNKMQ